MNSSILAESAEVGRLGESLAEQALSTKGFEPIDRNWRGPSGEIDLIVRDSNYIVFVEVKTRRSRTFGAPEESIGLNKTKRIADTALEYLLKTSQQESPWRIDVIAIELSHSNKVVRLTHYIGVTIE